WCEGPTDPVRRRAWRDLLAAIRPRKLDRGAARRQFRAGDHGGKSIQDMMLRLLLYFIRQGAVPSLAHVCTEFRDNRTGSFTCNGRTLGKYRSSEGSACSLQQPATGQVHSMNSSRKGIDVVSELPQKSERVFHGILRRQCF